MAKFLRVLDRVLRGTSDTNIPFADLCRLMHRLGFEERTRGSHHIFTREGIEEILNLQPRGNLAKAYQVRQVRDVVLKYGLADDEETGEEDETDGSGSEASNNDDDAVGGRA